MHWSWVRWMAKPGLALQSLTTREPDLDVIEVGIAAFKAMRNAEILPGVENQQPEIIL